jgi:hypothetical protein
MIYLTKSINLRSIVVQIYLTRKCTNHLQYTILQVRGRFHKKLCCENLFLFKLILF